MHTHDAYTDYTHPLMHTHSSVRSFLFLGRRKGLESCSPPIASLVERLRLSDQESQVSNQVLRTQAAPRPHVKGDRQKAPSVFTTGARTHRRPSPPHPWPDRSADHWPTVVLGLGEGSVIQSRSHV